MAVSGVKRRAVKAELDADKRSIASLWNDAVRDYTKDTGKQIASPTFPNSAVMIAFGAKEMNAFQKIAMTVEKSTSSQNVVREEH